MDGSGNSKKKQRTLASQPAAAAHVGAHAAMAIGTPVVASAQRCDGAGPPRTRLERILLAARQMQQH